MSFAVYEAMVGVLVPSVDESGLVFDVFLPRIMAKLYGEIESLAHEHMKHELGAMPLCRECKEEA